MEVSEGVTGLGGRGGLEKAGGSGGYMTTVLKLKGMVFSRLLLNTGILPTRA
jgi:hypothetical protein